MYICAPHHARSGPILFIFRIQGFPHHRAVPANVYSRPPAVGAPSNRPQNAKKTIILKKYRNGFDYILTICGDYPHK
jgi:hypothetical protein